MATFTVGEMTLRDLLRALRQILISFIIRRKYII